MDRERERDEKGWKMGDGEGWRMGEGREGMENGEGWRGEKEMGRHGERRHGEAWRKAEWGGMDKGGGMRRDREGME